jgi:hypothetical protein
MGTIFNMKPGHNEARRPYEEPPRSGVSALTSPLQSFRSDQRSPEKALLATHWAVAQNPFRSPKIIFDHANVRSTANPKLALRAQTIGFAAVSLREGWLPKILSCSLQGYGQQPTLKGPGRMEAHSKSQFLNPKQIQSTNDQMTKTFGI